MTLSTSGSSTILVLPTQYAEPISQDLHVSPTGALCKPTSGVKRAKKRAKPPRKGNVAKRALSLDFQAAVNPANAMWEYVEPEHALELIATVGDLPWPAWTEQFTNALQLVIDTGRRAADVLGLSATSLSAVALVLFLISLNRQNCLGPGANLFLIPNEAISGPGAQESVGSKKCPPDPLAPDCKK